VTTKLCLPTPLQFQAKESTCSICSFPWFIPAKGEQWYSKGIPALWPSHDRSSLHLWLDRPLRYWEAWGFYRHQNLKVNHRSFTFFQVGKNHAVGFSGTPSQCKIRLLQVFLVRYFDGLTSWSLTLASWKILQHHLASFGVLLSDQKICGVCFKGFNLRLTDIFSENNAICEKSLRKS